MSKLLLQFRLAKRCDVRRIVEMLIDDTLGAGREQLADSVPEGYYAAFDAIDADPNNELIVAYIGSTEYNDASVNHQNEEGDVIGVLQLTYIPSLSFQGGTRALIESVRVDTRYRSQGIGRQLMEWTLERARSHGCHLAQLTTHKSRTDAHRFYERMGFVTSHVGMKLPLKS